MENERATIGTKISKEMEEMILDIIERDTHLTKGELTRAALRHYLKENYPNTFRNHTDEPVEEGEVEKG